MIKVGRDFSRNSVWVSEKEALCRGAAVWLNHVRGARPPTFFAVSGAGCRGIMSAFREIQPQNNTPTGIFSAKHSIPGAYRLHNTFDTHTKLYSAGESKLSSL